MFIYWQYFNNLYNQKNISPTSIMTGEKEKESWDLGKIRTGFEVERVIWVASHVDALISADSEMVKLWKYVLVAKSGELYINGGKVKMFPKVIPAFMHAANKWFVVSQEELETQFGKLEMWGQYATLINAVLWQFPELQIQEPKKGSKKPRQYTPEDAEGVLIQSTTLVTPEKEKLRVQIYRKIQRGKKTMYFLQINGWKMHNLRTNYEHQLQAMTSLIASAYIARETFEKEFSSQAQLYGKLKILNEIFWEFGLKIVISQEDREYVLSKDGKRLTVEWE